MMGQPILRLEKVSKRYGGVRALEGADLEVEPGRIHAILGENGAGKSTLIKLIAGVVKPDEGQIMLDGRAVTFASPADAMKAGIVCVFQELSLIPDLNVADNIVISDPPRRFGLIDRKAQRRLAEEALARAGAADIHPLAQVKDLPLSRRQMVEIAKALHRKPRLLILDEATSALTSGDVDRVFAVLKGLRDQGLAALYISHRMHEIEELADTCTVFRNGRKVETYAAGTRTDSEVVGMMIGRELKNDFPPKPGPAPGTPPVLRVSGLNWSGRLSDIGFDLRPGEIIGLGGLDGQGQRELLLALFGVLRGVGGEITLPGTEGRPDSPAAARSAGMALIPEDRKTEGLMLSLPLRDNLTVASFGQIARGGIIDRMQEGARIEAVMTQLQIKAAGPDVAASSLSGGNQQKVVIAKWLMNRPRIILLNDPTRGIDVGTKQEIYTLLRDLAAGGAAILFYSTDHDELIGLCDRVLVLYDGKVRAELTGEALTQHALVAAALNIGAAA
jgi:ribose transport system ATP-binding protein